MQVHATLDYARPVTVLNSPDSEYASDCEPAADECVFVRNMVGPSGLREPFSNVRNPA